MSGGFQLLLRVLAGEGVRGFSERVLGRVGEWRRDRSFSPARPGEPLAAPLLNLLGTPPWPHLGGVQLQLAQRLASERAARAVALLFPRGGRFRLEHEDAGRRRALDFGPAPPTPPILRSPELERAVREALARTGAAAVHLENPAGLPLASLLALAEAGPPWILSVHDFSLFCPRPHLVEEPRHAFCHYSTDPERCAACLAHDWPVARGFQESRRGLAHRLLVVAAAAVYPSDFLRRRHLELFPGLDPSRHRVIAPAVHLPRLPPAPALPSPPAAVRVGPDGVPGSVAGAHTHPVRAPRHVAFVGSVQVHKGALLFEQVVRRLAPLHPHVAWSVFGGGDAEILRRLRRLPGVRVHGFYRPGTLPGRLRRAGVDFALLASIWPESYSIALEECAAAEVPVLAFDLGAPGERVRALGGGALVPLEGGAAAFAERLAAFIDGREPLPPLRTAGAPPHPAAAAAACLALYHELGLKI